MMTCPQCSAELPDSATFCLKCGANIRPVVFSYLPAGTATWPTTIPERPFYGHGSIDRSVQEEEHVSAAKLTPKPRRSAQSILAFVALLLLASLVGGGATLGTLWMNGQFPVNATQVAVHVPTVTKQTPVANSTPTTAQGNQLPTPTSFQTTTSSQVGISMKFPSDWVADAPQTTSSGNTSVNFHPTQQLPVDFSVGRLSAANSASVTNTGEVNAANIQGFGTSQSLTNLQLLSDTPQHSSIGGVSWDEQDATYTTSGGTVVHVVSISVKHNNIYYNIFYFAPSSVYDEAVQKYYSQMLASFQFTS